MKKKTGRLVSDSGPVPVLAAYGGLGRRAFQSVG